MEITRHNFYEQLDAIKKDIEESAFIAIDGEFTGLSVGENGQTSPFDTPQDRYHKIRYGCSNFLLVQFGMCIFKVDEVKQMYEAKPYNFYLFPKPISRNGPDKRFLCQSSSIDFLVSHGFDFNKLFREGIPYLTLEEEDKLRVELNRKHEEANKAPATEERRNSRKVDIPENQKIFMEDVCNMITEYLQKDDTAPLVLPPSNSFQKKLIYQAIEEKFPLTHVQNASGENNSSCLEVMKAKDTADRQRLQQRKQDMEKMELELQVGFSKVIRAITDSGKLVVGHNMMLDVFHVMSHFHCGLIDELDDFKVVTKSVFPRLLDTKLMASTQPFQEHISSSSLENLQKILRKPPFVPARIELAEGFDLYSKDTVTYHDAGYDSLATAECFVTMLNYLGSLQTVPAAFTSPSSHLVLPFINKLFLMKVNDIPYMNLDGPDLEGSRDHVFYVTYPKGWKNADLQLLFQPYGNIQICHLTGTSAYVGLHKKDNAALALKALCNNTGPYRVISYAAHRMNSAIPTASLPSMATQKRKLEQTGSEVLAKKPKFKPSEELSCQEDEKDLDISGSIKSDADEELNDGSSKGPEPMVRDTQAADKDKLFEESDKWE